MGPTWLPMGRVLDCMAGSGNMGDGNIMGVVSMSASEYVVPVVHWATRLAMMRILLKVVKSVFDVFGEMMPAK